MDIPESTILEIWDLICDSVPVNKRNDTALRLLRIIVEQDVDVADLDEIRGEDEHLDFALDELSEDTDASEYEDESSYEK